MKNYTLNMTIEKTDIEGFLKIQELLKNNEPIFIGRLSCFENRFVCNYILSNRLNDHSLTAAMSNNAGIYMTNDESKKKYCEQYFEAVKDSTIITGSRLTTYGLVNKLKKCIYNWKCLEPFYFMSLPEYDINNIWGNKRFLIISSQSNTMKQQINNGNIHKVFPKIIFSEYNLNNMIFIRPPITFAGNHNNIEWDENFNKLKEEIEKVKDQFDIALVSCGGYGLITTHFIHKELNRSSIYVGGALQVLFGIKGHRWDNNNNISCHYNEYWTRPVEEDIPKNCKAVEGGCYW
tara:strand:+ start:1213 stop:2085 length:873 start_codon:yes stop_codon:yes gene_type:complete